MAKNCALYVSKNCAVLLAEKCVLYLTIYTGLAKKILVEKFGWSKDLSVNGWRFFTQNSIVLNDLRDEIEGTISED